jgi:hypothetical protein
MISTPKAVLVGLISAPKDAPFSLLHLFVKLPSFAMLILTPASTSGWIGIWHCPQLAWLPRGPRPHSPIAILIDKSERQRRKDVAKTHLWSKKICVLTY